LDMVADARHKLQPGTVAIVGVPSDDNSSFLRGPSQAPAAIREALWSGASNLCAENGLDLDEESRFLDVGDLSLPLDKPGVVSIEAGIAELLDRSGRLLALGGDHAVTYPIVKAHARKYGRLNILHLDAHPDLYDEFHGNRHSHACPFARIMEENLASRLLQIGIRTMNPHQRSQADRFGVEVIEAREWGMADFGHLVKEMNGPIYLSLDMDVLDPAFAPGVSHHEPGGLSSRDVLDVIQGIRGPLVGADIVELNPIRDLAGTTTMAAVKFLKEIVAKLLTEF